MRACACPSIDHGTAGHGIASPSRKGQWFAMMGRGARCAVHAMPMGDARALRSRATAARVRAGRRSSVDLWTWTEPIQAGEGTITEWPPRPVQALCATKAKA